MFILIFHLLKISAFISRKNDFAQYRLENFILKDEFYNLPKAVEWLEKAVVNNNQYAKYALAKILIADEQYKKC